MAKKDLTSKNYTEDPLKLEKRQKEQSEYLRTLVMLEKENQAMTDDEINLLKKVTDNWVDTSAKTASMLSKSLGSEEAFVRDISHEMTEMFNKNKDYQVAYKKASTEDKALMLSQMREEFIKKSGFSKEFLEQNKDLMDNAFVKVDESMDKIVEKSGKLLYPLVKGISKSLGDFRLSLTDKFPKTFGRLLSDEVVEHYRAGANEIGSHFKTHMSAILAPLDAITGPIIAVSKSLFTIGKTLFSGPTKHEKALASTVRQIRDNKKGEEKVQTQRWFSEKRTKMKQYTERKMLKLREMAISAKRWISDNKDKIGQCVKQVQLKAQEMAISAKRWIFDKKMKLREMALTAKRWAIDRKMRLREYFANDKEKGKGFLGFLKKIIIPLLALGVGMLIGYMEQVKRIFSPIISALKFIGGSFGKVSTWFGKIAGKLGTVGGKIMSILTKGPIGKLFMFAGKVFGRLFMPLKMIWNFFKDFGQIQELFAAGDLFGIFKHILSSIIEPIADIPEMLINGLSWLFGSDFRVDFGKEELMKGIDAIVGWIVRVFDVVKNFLTGAAKKIFGKIGKFFGLGEDEDSLKTSMPYDEFGDDMMSSPRDIKTSEVKTYAKIGKKVVDSPPSLLGGTRAKASQVNKQLDATNSTNDKLDQTNTKITETNKTQQIILNQQSMNVEIKDEIPTETENMGVLFMTTSWGVGGA